MAEKEIADLGLLVEQQRQILIEIRSIRDDLVVQGARIERVDNTMQSLLGELRAGDTRPPTSSSTPSFR
jgi:hypothetical protein